MNEYILSCCSPCDLTAEQMRRINVPFMPFHFFVNDKDNFDDMGKTVTTDYLYGEMEKGAEVRSSQVSIGEYRVFFEGLLQEGKDILHITLSSGISGTYNSAKAAASILSMEYPDRKIKVIDSLAACSGYGLFMDFLAENKNAGVSMDELEKIAEEEKHKVNHLFFSTDLKYYIKGGRISKTAGMVGTLLNICPLLCVSPDGKLVPLSKKRGKKQVMEAMVSEMEERAQDGNMYSGRCYIAHSACLADAVTVKAMIEEKFPNLKNKVNIYPIGTTIGCHTGPGTVALFFLSPTPRRV